MKKLLFIITRAQDEFGFYWQSKTEKNADSRNVYIVNGSLLEEINDGEFCSKLHEVLHRKIDLSNTQIGIIFHGNLGDKKVDCLAMENSKVAFFKRYSSTKSELTENDGNNFTATLCEGTKPLDKLRDAVVVSCENSDFVKAFDDVWSFFSGDPILESKLTLLHLCLMPKSRPELTEFDEGGAFNMLSDFKDDYKELMNAKVNKPVEVTTEFSNEDVFHPQYLEALRTLRDKLLDS